MIGIGSWHESLLYHLSKAFSREKGFFQMVPPSNQQVSKKEKKKKRRKNGGMEKVLHMAFGQEAPRL